MKILIISTVLVLVSIEGISQNVQSKLSRDSIEVEGKYRTFEYFAPVILGSTPSLIFVLHGSNGNVDQTRMITSYEFEKIAAERKNYIIVYPEGYGRHWNDCRKTGGYIANKEDINDIAFFSEMIEYFVEKFEVDSERVFASGISNGGHMCYKLAFELPDKISGIAPFVANIPMETNNDCSPAHDAVPVIIINGTADPINPYQGGWVVVGQDSSRGAVHSTEQTVSYWKGLLPCEPNVEIVKYENSNTTDDSSLEHYKYSCYLSNTRAELLKVNNGGHTVPLINAPDIPPRIRKILGNTNKDVNSPLLVVEFFESLSDKR